MVDVSAERRLLVATAHARQDAVAFLVEVVRGRGVDHEGPARGRPREPARRHDHAWDGFQWKVYPSGRRERPGPRPRRVHHDGRGDGAILRPDTGDGRTLRLDLNDLDTQTHVGAGTTSERRVSLREPCRIGDAIVGAEGRTHDVIDRDARRDTHRLVGRQELCVDTERSLQLRSGAEVGPVVLVPHEEQVPILHDVERQPVLLGEPQDHGHARQRQLDVDAAGELMPEPSGASAGRAGRDAIRAFEQNDVLDPGGGQVVRRARAHDASADDHDVRRGHPVSSSAPLAAPTAARATIRSSNASPTDLKTVMSSGDVRTSAPCTTSARSATT